MQGYLGTLSISRIVELQREVDAALEQCEDSNRHMAVYRGGDDLLSAFELKASTRTRNP